MSSILQTPGERPRDAARTRDAILQAAIRLFTTQGYATTGVREIAAEAGINATLVGRYFGSKQGLLRAVLETLLNVDPIIAGDRGGFGERAATMLLGADDVTNPVAVMLLAMADHGARALCARLVQERVIAPLAEWLGGGDGAADRAAQLNLLWTGFIIAHRLIPLQQLGAGHVAATKRWLAVTSQAIADDERPVARSPPGRRPRGTASAAAG